MKAGARSFRTLALSLTIFAVLVLVALGIKRLRSDELTGLNYVGPIPTTQPPPPPPAGASDAEFIAHWYAVSLADFGEPPIGKLVHRPDAEAYRFSYQPTFNPQVCVTIWRDGDRYFIRTAVISWQPAMSQWSKTETISARKWNRLRTAFTRHSVTDPLEGTDPYGGIDGSSWFMESLVSGRVALTRVSNPVRTIGFPHFQIVKSRDPRLDDFVKTCFLFLDWAGVRVPEMH